LSTRREVDGTSTDKELHILGVTQDGKLLHTSRLQQSEWQPFDDLTTSIGDSGGKFQAVGGNEFRGTLDICVIVHTKQRQQRILHTSRGSNGIWNSFEDVNALTGFSGSFISADCVASFVPGLLLAELHVCGVTDDRKLLHTIRFTDPRWLPFANVGFLSANAPNSFANVSIAHGLHVCTQAGGDIWHTIRFAADAGAPSAHPPHWQPAFDDVEKQAGRPDVFGSVSCTITQASKDKDELHVCGVTTDGRLQHTFLSSTVQPPKWQSFEDLTQLIGNPGSFTFVSITGDPHAWGPIGGGGDPTCQQISLSIGNDKLQMQAMQKQKASTKDSTAKAQISKKIAELQQHIASLQNRAKQHKCH